MTRTRMIFLVEDDDSDQYFFLLAVKEIENVMMYDVARNGQEALARLKGATSLPDIIFTDINMPVMGGKEYLMEIVKDPATGHIPVVVLSSDISEVQNVRDIGARAFIRKPEDYQTLRLHLEHVLNIDFETQGHIADQTFITAVG